MLKVYVLITIRLNVEVYVLITIRLNVESVCIEINIFATDANPLPQKVYGLYTRENINIFGWPLTIVSEKNIIMISVVFLHIIL